MRRQLATVLAASISAISLPAAADGLNKFCVSKVAEHPMNVRMRELHGEAVRLFEYSVQVDDGPIVPTDETRGFEYPIEKIAERYLVKIRNGGKMVESFWLKPEGYKSGAVCLWFQAPYHAWSVWSLADSRHFCDCSE